MHLPIKTTEDNISSQQLRKEVANKHKNSAMKATSNTTARVLNQGPDPHFHSKM